MKIFMIVDFKPDQIDRVRTELGYDVVSVPKGSPIPYDQIGDAEVVVCYKEIENLELDRLPNLKLVQLTSIGFDQVPKEAVLERGIMISNNKGCFSIPIGEWIVWKILEIYKAGKSFYKNQSQRHWEWNMNVMELCQKTVGFFGTGSVATEGAKRIAAFDTAVYGLNTEGRDTPHYDRCYSFEQRYEMASLCDVIVCVLPSSEKTYHIIDDKMLAAMKPGSILINVGRGDLVEEAALIQAVQSGKLRGAALDVFETEPLDRASPLWDVENIYISSHNSWVSENSMDRIFETAFETLKRYKNNETLLNIVDLRRGY